MNLLNFLKSNINFSSIKLRERFLQKRNYPQSSFVGEKIHDDFDLVVYREDDGRLIGYLCSNEDKRFDIIINDSYGNFIFKLTYEYLEELLDTDELTDQEILDIIDDIIENKFDGKEFNF